MILTITFWIIVVFFGLKILGNLLLAYGTLVQNEDEGSSISILLLLDVLLLFLISILGWFLGEEVFPYGGISAFKWCLSIIVISYAHYFAVMLVGSKLKK